MLQISEAYVEHFNEITKLFTNLKNTLYLSRQSELNWTEETLNQELLEAKTYISKLDHEIVAFICFRETIETYEITILATGLGFLRRGFQTELLGQLKKMSISQKKQIWLEVHESNLEALNFYKKNGFKEVGLRQKYYSDGAAALLMSYGKQT